MKKETRGRHGNDKTLEKNIEHFPGSSVVEPAQSRLAHLKLEIKGEKEEPPGTKPGVYEQNIGLKYGSPHSPH